MRTEDERTPHDEPGVSPFRTAPAVGSRQHHRVVEHDAELLHLSRRREHLLDDVCEEIEALLASREDWWRDPTSRARLRYEELCRVEKVLLSGPDEGRTEADG